MWRERSLFYDGKQSYDDKTTFPEKCYELGHNNVNNVRYFYEESVVEAPSKNLYKRKTQVVVYETEFAFPTFNTLQEAKIHKSILINFAKNKRITL